MNANRTAGVLAVVAALGLAGGIAARGRGARQAASGQMTEEERARLMAKGKEIFMEKCAKCHNEHGDKALSTGQPLSERGLTTEAIARAVNGRLKDRTDEERRAVTLYIASLMKAHSEEK